MDRIVNVELLTNPINWIIVALMLAIGTFGLHLVLSQAQGTTPTQGIY
jgi:hypothetical protein